MESKESKDSKDLKEPRSDATEQLGEAGSRRQAQARSDEGKGLPAVALPAAAAVAARKEQEFDTAETASVASSRSQRSARSLGTQSSVASEFIQERIPVRQRETARIQQEMKGFVRDMVKGRQMGVLSPDGQLRNCSCSLDKRLKNFVIELKGAVRRIPLSELQEVYQGKEPEDIDTPLDERSATLMLESGECISFHFDSVAAREHFAMCLQILVDGQQS